MIERLRIDTGNRDDAFAVSLSGGFDISEAGVLSELPWTSNGQAHVELDLSERTFIDPTGLRELLRFEADMRAIWARAAGPTRPRRSADVRESRTPRSGSTS